MSLHLDHAVIAVNGHEPDGIAILGHKPGEVFELGVVAAAPTRATLPPRRGMW
jgi:hypothetical protein